MKNIIFYLMLILLFSCNKVNYSKMNEVIGDYEDGFSILKNSDTDLLLRYWPTGGKDVLLNIDEYELTIVNQVFVLPNGGQGNSNTIDYYELRVNAVGTIKNNFIDMKYTEESKDTGDTEFTISKTGHFSISKK